MAEPCGGKHFFFSPSTAIFFLMFQKENGGGSPWRDRSKEKSAAGQLRSLLEFK
jgi:hypothetical protein